MSLTEVKEKAIAYSDIPVIECEPTHCRNCPYFEGYGDRGRGICKLFDRVEREDHTITQDCKNKIKSENPPTPSLLSRPEVKKPKVKAFPWVSMLGMVASTAIFTSTTPRAIAATEQQTADSPQTQTEPQPKDQSPHRGTGRRELYQAVVVADPQLDADVEYVLALEAKHEADFYAQHESVVEVGTVLRNGKAVCGVWCGTRLIGTYYRDIKGHWAADSTVKQIRDRFDDPQKAKEAIVKAWKSSRN